MFHLDRFLTCLQCRGHFSKPGVSADLGVGHRKSCKMVQSDRPEKSKTRNFLTEWLFPLKLKPTSRSLLMKYISQEIPRKRLWEVMNVLKLE